MVTPRVAQDARSQDLQYELKSYFAVKLENAKNGRLFWVGNAIRVRKNYLGKLASLLLHFL